jgi:hypothetical protein
MMETIHPSLCFNIKVKDWKTKRGNKNEKTGISYNAYVSGHGFIPDRLCKGGTDWP